MYIGVTHTSLEKLNPFYTANPTKPRIQQRHETHERCSMQSQYPHFIIPTKFFIKCKRAQTRQKSKRLNEEGSKFPNALARFSSASHPLHATYKILARSHSRNVQRSRASRSEADCDSSAPSSERGFGFGFARRPAGAGFVLWRKYGFALRIIFFLSLSIPVFFSSLVPCLSSFALSRH